MTDLATQPNTWGQAFLDLANQGKTRWGTYLLSLFVIISVWLLGSVVLLRSYSVMIF